MSLRLPNEGTDPYELLAEVLKKLGREKELTERLEKLHAGRPGQRGLGLMSWPDNTAGRDKSTRPKRSTWRR